MERIEVLLIEDSVTGFVQVPYGDTKFAKKDRKHTAQLTRVPNLGEKIRIKVKDDPKTDLVNIATFRVSEPPTHLDPSACMTAAPDWNVEAICTVYRVTE